MLFNSYRFLFLFLPIVFVGFRLFAWRGKHKSAVGWLVFSSLFFCAHWNISLVALLSISLTVNYLLGRLLSDIDLGRKCVLVIGIVGNLALIGYYKYLGFFSEIIHGICGTQLVELEGIILPLGISFWTFQQISYLVDVYRDKSTCEESMLYYFAYILFFPQLIAGPIVRHNDFIWQLKRDSLLRLSYRNILIGICLFSFGLFKKVAIADVLSPKVAQIFDVDVVLTSASAWVGALAYTLQLYFDFSGYSDMAMGLALLFNLHLPRNFNSPYRATSIVDFWRRWHITLSSFLRDYLYIPLGGKYRRYSSILWTMLLGGLWHGAGWNFIFWGGLHGVALCVNHIWRKTGRVAPKIVSWGGTMIVVTVCWVFFRANSLEQAFNIVSAMFMIDCGSGRWVEWRQVLKIMALMCACRYLPEPISVLNFNKSKKVEFSLKYRNKTIFELSGMNTTISKTVIALICLLWALYRMNTAPMEFLYFQF